MASVPNKLVTWNIKKDDRFAKKKRKIEALINLFEEEEAKQPTAKKKGKDSLEENYKSLKQQLKEYTKKPEVKPSFTLTADGVKAEINLKCPESKSFQSVEPLFLEDIYQLLLKSVIGHMSPYPLNWAKLKNPENINKTVLLVIEGFSKWDVLKNISELNNLSNLFPHVVEIVSSNISFATELNTLHLVTDFHIRTKDTYSTMFPKDKEVKMQASTNCDLPSKLHLLLSPIQMVMEDYPFPASVFGCGKTDNYVFSKKCYAPVSQNSPMFALDCEMCLTVDNLNELTRIAVVNESLETVYHTLVKPKAKIMNYLTRYSGITKEMLNDVVTQLSDVQDDLQKLLPADAILCGQSLNCDLHALRMIHPYVIDTSIIFNESGIRSRKVSLKNLVKIHLKESIQNGWDGHNPVEDSIAAMKLVLLKLENNLQFGDACLKDCSVTNESSSNSKSNQPPSSTTETVNNETSATETVSSSKINDGFFAKLAQFSKNCCLIGNETSLGHYDDNMLNDKVKKKVKYSREKILKASLKEIESSNLIISHLNYDITSEQSSVSELNSVVGQLYDSCDDKTMFMVLISGVDEKNYTDIKRSLLMTVLKNSK
ncbi:RNA exonuclease 5 [Trichonephila clavata]|uniref:RNA exonuclease 5 n=1 Tax=Trichonephila clavata TaxID=2740835 RepID=A0A8X6GS77_TRICU|nr:RNA exonuclease 5 [Trichonephila clavata]